MVRRLRSISNQEFVEAWMKVWAADQPLDDVCVALDLTKESVYHRATLLRSKGVELPRFTRRVFMGTREITSLNKLIKGVDV